MWAHGMQAQHASLGATRWTSAAFLTATGTASVFCFLVVGRRAACFFFCWIWISCQRLGGGDRKQVKGKDEATFGAWRSSNICSGTIVVIECQDAGRWK